jgi:ribonucleoside-diphosphate reductase beta chain
MLESKKLFNPNGSDIASERQLIGGNPTNLFNLNNVKYKWTNGLYTVMMGNFWIPEKIGLEPDKKQYKSVLNEDEIKAFDSIFSFLIFLDSIQTVNLPNISDFITAPEVNILLSIQQYQEALHSKSYAYVVESIIPASKKDYIYNIWREDPILLKRISYIASIYEEFVVEKSELNFAKVVLANYLLEGLYFYNGFNFFYSLGYRQLIPGVVQEIRYINRDELTHVNLFTHLIKDLRKERPDLFPESLVREMFTQAVEMEIEWTNHILGDKIDMITPETTEEYTKYLANQRIKALGYHTLYHGYNENPYKHLSMLSNDDADVKTNFFEGKVTDYSRSEVLKGWDEI